MKKIGISKKMLLSMFAVLIAGTLIASAGMLTYYGTIETTANVDQSVQLRYSGNWINWNEPLPWDFTAVAGSCICKDFLIRNQAEVEAPITLDTEVYYNGAWRSPDSLDSFDVTYYLDEWTDDDSGLYNGVNNENDPEPYITWVINGDGTIDITFHNPTTYYAVFDYRVDGESGEDHQWTHDTIGQGPCEGEKFGQKYNWVSINGVGEETVTVEPCYEVMVGHRVGAEQNGYIPWITIERPELDNPYTLEPGEQLDFIIEYCFALKSDPVFWQDRPIRTTIE